MAYVLGNSGVAVVSGTSVVTTIDRGGAGPFALGVNPATGYVYVAEFVSHTLLVLSGTNVITTLPTGITPAGVGVNESTGYAYVSNQGSDSITVISGTQVLV
jgi:DNA-binding beta-propeller fold protein YncE